jgi:integrase/recombinase XerC
MDFWKWLIKKHIIKTISWRDFIFLTLIINYGRRITELKLLRTEDFDFEKNIIWFRQLKTRERDPEDRPKHIMQRILPYIQSYVEYCRRIGQEELFECTVRTLRNACYKYTKEYFGRRLFPHVFRYVLTTYLNRKIVSLQIVKDFFGHKNIQTTQRYSRLSIEDVRNALPKDLR